MLMTTNIARDEETQFAIDECCNYLDVDDIPNAISRLEYARRMRPADDRITIVLGLLRLRLGDRSGLADIEVVARKTGAPDQLLSLIVAYNQFYKHDQAIIELHNYLSKNAVTSQYPFRALADHICECSNSPGWCGIDNAGQLTIGGSASGINTRQLEILVGCQPAQIGSEVHDASNGTKILRITGPWYSAEQIVVLANSDHLIGSPIIVSSVTRMESLVRVLNGGVEGWCWYPGEPELMPKIRLESVLDPRRKVTVQAKKLIGGLLLFEEFALPRQFTASTRMLKSFDGPIRVVGLHERTLYGSPVSPRASTQSAVESAVIVRNIFPLREPVTKVSLRELRPRITEPSIPVDLSMPKPDYEAPKTGRPVDIIIPVFQGFAATKATINSVLKARSVNERIIVVSDASPQNDLVDWLKRLADQGLIILISNRENLGFPGTVNVGLRMNDGGDVVLLNSDTLVPPRWLVRLQNAVYSANDIGTATPLSNDATIFSYPISTLNKSSPDLEQTLSLDDFAFSANADLVVDVPTGHGFCMYIRSECLLDTGLLREDTFGQGYGEENDFCMRARTFGWRHVAVPGLFVAHVGGQSFTSSKTALIKRNLTVLNRLHVGYDAVVQAWIKADTLAESRRRIDIKRFLDALNKRHSVLLVTHRRTGGVWRHVLERAATHRLAGDCVIILRPLEEVDGQHQCQVICGADLELQNLIFRLPLEAKILLDFLESALVRYVEFHHFLGFHHSVFKLVRRLGCPYDVVIHDYSWFCPRITLTNNANGYCGEPNITACGYCVADNGSEIEEDTSPLELVQRSTDFLEAARTVVAPSFDTAQRVSRHFSTIHVEVGIWEETVRTKFQSRQLKNTTFRRICVVGAIGFEKGYNILLACARIVAKQNLPIEFCLVGYSKDDKRLFHTGCVKITGPYEEREAVDLIRAQGADFGFIPSIWPETWCYALTQIWDAGLQVVTFDIGAPAERIRLTGGGRILPVNLSPERLIHFFLNPDIFK
jgi:GT2 family glycosyltransferase/glycosyltransferase involved in cell wall biosynthesis